MTRPRRCWPQIEIRVRFLPLVLFFVAVALARDFTGVLRIGLLCALLHECGHLAAWGVLVRRPPRVCVSPTGLCLSMRGVILPPGQELVLAAAGPCTNLMLSAVAIVWMEYVAGYSFFGYRFAAANLLLGAFNLLPLPGLDGGYLLHDTVGLHFLPK